MALRSRALLALAAAACSLASATTGAGFSAGNANPDNTIWAAASFCTGPGTRTIVANRDTWADEARKDTNFGSDTKLVVQSKKNQNNARGFVGFALPTPPERCTVTSATLRLVTAAAGDAGRTLQVFRIEPLATWSDATLTWSNQPAIVPAASPPSATSIASGALTWSVTTLVQAMYASSNPSNGLMVRDQAEEQPAGKLQTYTSLQGAPAANFPELTITFG